MKNKILFIALLIFLLAGALVSVFNFINYFRQNQNKNGDENIQTQNNNETILVNSSHFEPINKDIFDGFYNRAKQPERIGKIKGAITPHHLLAGQIPATLFDFLSKQKPSTVVLFGPNHFFTGKSKAIATAQDWSTMYGPVKTDKKLLKKLVDERVVQVDEAAIQDEHSIYGLIPFIARSLPDTKVLSFMLRYKTDAETLDKIAKSLQDTLPKDAVIIASIDFSHYQILPSANFHDELTEQIVKNFDYSRFSKLEIDSEPSLYLLSKMMEYYGTQKVAFELRDNSANILKNPGLKETTSYYSPYFVNGKKENIKISSILNFGDIMLDRNVKAQIDKNGSDYIFKELAGQENRFLTGMDIIEANLEGPFANYRRETTKSIAFRFDPKLIATLLKYNFGLFSLANNHSLDMSKKGFEESKENLKSAGINFYGQQFFITDENLLVKQIGDFKFGLIGLDDTVNKIDIVKVKKLVENAKTQGAEIILANVHWGDEYKTVSNAQQRQLAHDLVDLGVDVIIGHHPHVVQEMEIYKNRPIFYSLGNFIFDQYFSVLTQQGLAVGLIFKQNESKIQLSTYVFPIEGAKSQTKLMDYEKTQKFFDAWLKTSRLENNQFENYNLKINF